MNRLGKVSTMTRLCVLVLVLLLVVLPGCPWLIDPYVWVDPEVEVAGKTLLVVPFSDGESTYFASEDGNSLTALIGRQVATRSPKARLADADEVRRLYDGRELETVGWKTVGQDVGADYVLVGHVVSFTLKDSPTSNLYAGTIKLRLKVVDAADGAVVWLSGPPESTYRWTGVGDPEHGIPVFDISAEQVRLQTLRLAANNVADVFCVRKMTRAQFQDYQRRRQP